MNFRDNKQNNCSNYFYHISSILVLLAFSLLTYRSNYVRFNIDEEIPLSVMLYLHQSATLNTNWANADLVSYFRYDQFNFSSYILLSYAILKILSTFFGIFESRQTLLLAIQNLSVFYACMTLLLIQLMVSAMFERRTALFAMTFTAAAPLFVQDALYARPESFTSLGFMLLLWCALRTWSEEWRFAVASGLIVGFLTATKITLAALALLPVIYIFMGSTRRDDGERLRVCYLIMLLMASAGIGFAMGAPYALIDPEKYLNGVKYLMNQYSGAHPPHGPADSTFLKMITHVAEYFWDTIGPLSIFAVLGGAILLRKGDAVQRAGLVFIPVIFVSYFLSKSVFFERNLTHVMPALTILAALALSCAGSKLASITGNKIVAVALPTATAIMLLVQPAGLSYALTVIQAGGAGQRDFARFEAELRRRFDGFQIVDVGFSDIVTGVLPKSDLWNVIFKVTDFRDDWTHRYLAQPGMSGFSTVAHYYNSFTAVKGSTLHTYHAPDFVYLMPRKSPGTLITRSFSVIGQWQQGGCSPQTKPLPFIVLGSWAGNDANTGILKTESFIGNKDEELSVLVTRGPDAAGLRLELVTADDDQPVAEYPVNGLKPHEWAAWRFVVPERLTGQRFSLIAVDEGTAWGQWLGISAVYQNDALRSLDPGDQLNWYVPRF